MRNYILMISLFLAVHLYGQEIPLPQHCFPLNGTNPEDIRSGQVADIHGSIYALTDRFGNDGKAVSFGKEDSYLSFPIVNEQVGKSVTFTYWMYVAEDSITQTFWATGGNGELLFGMKRKGLRAVLDIYHKNSQQNVLPDQQWMWSDSNFTEGAGWYFVAIAYSDNGTHFYLGTLKGKMTECYSAFTPDWNLVAAICIGAVDGIPAAGMDDFKVYDAALSKEQISALYYSESQLNMGNVSLLNVETDVPLYASAWYFHCVGLKETFQYAMQNQANLSFLSADTGYSLFLVPDMKSDDQKWVLSPVKDTTKGRVFTICNSATGMNLTDMHEEVLQQVPDNTDFQRWYIGQLDNISQTKSSIEASGEITPLSEEIYFDRNAGVIRVHIHFPKVENVRVRLTDLQGRLLQELYSGKVMILEKDIRQQVNGIYMITVESDSYRINKKVFVNN